jgi:hypothetical protein
MNTAAANIQLASEINRGDADRRLPMVLRLQGLPDAAAAETWRLLRLLLLWHGPLSTDSARADVLRRKRS